jgi:hypothetical protein
MYMKSGSRGTSRELTDLVTKLDKLLAGNILVPEETDSSAGDWQGERSVVVLMDTPVNARGLTQDG